MKQSPKRESSIRPIMRSIIVITVVALPLVYVHIVSSIIPIIDNIEFNRKLEATTFVNPQGTLRLQRDSKADESLSTFVEKDRQGGEICLVKTVARDDAYYYGTLFCHTKDSEGHLSGFGSLGRFAFQNSDFTKMELEGEKGLKPLVSEIIPVDAYREILRFEQSAEYVDFTDSAVEKAERS